MANPTDNGGGGAGGGLPNGPYQNAKAIYEALLGFGLNANAAAGVAGNVYQESGGNPGAANGAGGGLFGETIANGGSAGGGSLSQQLQALLSYINANGGIGPINANASSPAAAAEYFSNVYERPGDPEMQNRVAAAEWVAAAAASGNWGAGESTASAPTPGNGQSSDAADQNAVASAIQSATAMVHDVAVALNLGYDLVQPGQTWRLVFAGLGTVTAVQALKSYGPKFSLSLLLAGGSSVCWYMSLRAWPMSSTGHPVRPAAYLADVATGKPPKAGPAPSNETSTIETGLIAIVSIWAAGEAASAISSAGGLLSNLFGRGSGKSAESDVEKDVEDVSEDVGEDLGGA